MTRAQSVGFALGLPLLETAPNQRAYGWTRPRYS